MKPNLEQRNFGKRSHFCTVLKNYALEASALSLCYWSYDHTCSTCNPFVTKIMKKKFFCSFFRLNKVLHTWSKVRCKIYWKKMKYGRTTDYILRIKSISKWNPATLLKKRLSHRCFPVSFAKFLKTPLIASANLSLIEVYFNVLRPVSNSYIILSWTLFKSNIG